MGENKNKESIQDIIENARKQVAEEKNLNPAIRATFDVLIALLSLLVEKRIPKNSKNSSIPPSADPNREKKPKETSGKKPGGQFGHKGSCLDPVKNPDHVVSLKVDRSKLPPGNWKVYGLDRRQLFEIKTYLEVTEYQGEVLVNEKGEKVTADFPDGLVQAAQYGNTVKAHAVYMSVYQLIPCDRLSEQFGHQYDIPISSGSICNFKKEAHDALETYETWVKKKLQGEPVLHLDETGINIAGKRAWIHTASSEHYTDYLAHNKRGKIAMDEMGIIPNTDAILVHDHWKAYYRYKDKTHALCNEHHGRELEYETESGIKWAEPMSELLLETNKLTTESGGILEEEDQERVRKKYREILAAAEIECPPPPPKPDGKRGRVAKTKARNLLERLRDFENDVLRFMTNVHVPFTNNLAERDLRMNKVHQKISGCFRSIENANIFCRIRGYLSTCAKNNVSATEALNLLFQGSLPGFIDLAE